MFNLGKCSWWKCKVPLGLLVYRVDGKQFCSESCVRRYAISVQAQTHNLVQAQDVWAKPRKLSLITHGKPDGH